MGFLRSKKMPNLIAFRSPFDDKIYFEKKDIEEKSLSKVVYSCRELHGYIKSGSTTELTAEGPV